jgi:ABC-2 type transport system ATP-binding protein
LRFLWIAVPALFAENLGQGTRSCPEDRRPVMLQFDSAHKRFGSLRALDGCTFEARPGRLTGFLGPNGAGKTTAMRAVFGLLQLDEGLVTWRGSPIVEADRARFGYMPEERGLYPRMRVREQLVYLGELCGRSSSEVSRVTDLWLERLGIAERAAARVDELSHGNQQRVQLLAALVNEPDLLVLDEPFAGLDPIAMGAMAGLLQELAATGVTVLFSSHQLDLVEDLCQDVVIIDHGRVVLAGELEALRAATPQRIVDVHYRGPAPEWSGVPHVRVLESTVGSVRLTVSRDTEIAALVSATTAADEVTSFTYQPPTLSDLFREAVRT